jgi:hypothetical protein
MAKIPFGKLKLTKNTEVSTFEYEGNEIEVKQYLPVEDKLTLVSNIINESIDENGYYNEGKIRIFRSIELLLAYTNIGVTDKQREDPMKLYDLVFSNSLGFLVFELIPKEEIDFIDKTLYTTIHSIYEYKNSALGIMQNLVDDYKDVDFSIDKIQQDISNPENIGLLRDVVQKLG